MESGFGSKTSIPKLVRIGGTMKKIFVSTTLVLLLVLASAALASAAGVEVSAPFKGTIQGTESHVISFPNMYLDGSGSGNAILLGEFSFHYTGVVDLLTSAGTGLSIQLVAANGDTLNAAGYGQGNPSGNITYVTEWYTITGGTGRFKNASGSFTLKRQVNKITDEMSGEFDGTITLVNGQ